MPILYGGSVSTGTCSPCCPAPRWTAYWLVGPASIRMAGRSWSGWAPSAGPARDRPIASTTPPTGAGMTAAAHCVHRLTRCRTARAPRRRSTPTSRLSNLPLRDFVSDYSDRPGHAVGAALARDDGPRPICVARAGPGTVKGRGLTLPAIWTWCRRTSPDGAPTLSRSPGSETPTWDAGAADMKGFLALAINRLARTRPDALRRPLALLLTYDEEVGTLGARRFAEQRARRPASRATSSSASPPRSASSGCTRA